jgi:dipeptidyl aminopeptidase/acylaminoacyl peptidase
MYGTNVFTLNGRRRRRTAALGPAVLLLVAGVVVTLVGNDYRTDERRVSIPTNQGRLDGVLSVPEDGAPRGLVLVVHGDGPVEATHDGLYRPWFEAAADAGFATLSWSKPGVGASTGDWLDQSMNDRADEVSDVIDWAQRDASVPTNRIVLWGASQAGWVLPKVAAARTDVDAIVAVSPAISWLRQGRFNLLAELDHEGVDDEARQRAISISDQTRVLLDQQADYETYRQRTTDPEPMDRARWGFVSRNHTADATGDLTRMAHRRVPVLLMLGEHDRNVDVDETASTYRRLLGDTVDVARFDAAHSMARPIVEDCGAAGLITGVVWPRALLAPGVLDTYRDYLADLP